MYFSFIIETTMNSWNFESKAPLNTLGNTG